MKFKTDRLELLKELRALILQEMNNSKVNVDLEYDVAEFLTEVKDKRRLRRLKLVRRELDKWIDEMVDTKKEEKSNETPNKHS